MPIKQNLFVLKVPLRDVMPTLPGRRRVVSGVHALQLNDKTIGVYVTGLYLRALHRRAPGKTRQS